MKLHASDVLHAAPARSFPLEVRIETHRGLGIHPLEKRILQMPLFRHAPQLGYCAVLLLQLGVLPFGSLYALARVCRPVTTASIFTAYIVLSGWLEVADEKNKGDAVDKLHDCDLMGPVVRKLTAISDALLGKWDLTLTRTTATPATSTSSTLKELIHKLNRAFPIPFNPVRAIGYLTFGHRRFGGAAAEKTTTSRSHQSDSQSDSGPLGHRLVFTADLGASCRTATSPVGGATSADRASCSSTKVNYVFGLHPHGILSLVNGMAFAMCGDRVRDVFPNVASTRLAGLPAVFQVPLLREFLLYIYGSISSGASAIRYNLETKKRSVCLVPGGALESLFTEFGCDVSEEDASKSMQHEEQGAEAADRSNGTHSGEVSFISVSRPLRDAGIDIDKGYHAVNRLRLILADRKGFVRLAILSQTPLVPVLGYGENSLYRQGLLNESWRMMQMNLQKTAGFGCPLAYGATKWLPPIPAAVPMMTSVFGAPVSVSVLWGEVEQVCAKLGIQFSHLVEQVLVVEGEGDGGLGLGSGSSGKMDPGRQETPQEVEDTSTTARLSRSSISKGETRSKVLPTRTRRYWRFKRNLWKQPRFKEPSSSSSTKPVTVPEPRTTVNPSEVPSEKNKTHHKQTSEKNLSQSQKSFTSVVEQVVETVLANPRDRVVVVPQLTAKEQTPWESDPLEKVVDAAFYEEEEGSSSTPASAEIASDGNSPGGQDGVSATGEEVSPRHNPFAGKRKYASIISIDHQKDEDVSSRQGHDQEETGRSTSSSSSTSSTPTSPMKPSSISEPDQAKRVLTAWELQNLPKQVICSITNRIHREYINAVLELHRLTAGEYGTPADQVLEVISTAQARDPIYMRKIRYERDKLLMGVDKGNQNHVEGIGMAKL
ncbi:unnamed protein product [Amoebophrya sp. A25]|nr:unnamed protein product [Amoebophrya sp. A25]|eukprot:GSA25T00003731001.1